MILRFAAVVLAPIATFLFAWLVGVSCLYYLIRKKPDHLKQVWIGIDQLANTCFGGWADEAISARAWREQDRKTKWHNIRIFIDWLFRPWQQDHCYKSYQNERERMQSAPEYREIAGENE